MNIIVTNNTYYPNYEAKLKPLSKVSKVKKIFMVTKIKDSTLDKLEICKLPGILSHDNIISKLLNFIFSKNLKITI